MTNSRMTLPLSLFLIATSFGCASALGKRMGWDKPAKQSLPAKLTDPAFATCDGDKAKKKFVFTLSTNIKVPSGMKVSDASGYANSRESLFKFTSTNWIQHLLSRGLVGARVPGTSDGKETSFSYGAIKPLADYADSGTDSIIRTGPFNFIMCNQSSCKDLVDPISKARIVEAEYKATQNGYGFEQCKWYHVPGIDPAPQDPSFWSLKRETYPSQCYPKAQYDHGGFMLDTGFRGGTMFSVSYFQVPQSEKENLCEAASLSRDCFQDPTADSLLDFCRDKASKRKFPFLHHYLTTYATSGEGNVCINYNKHFVMRKFLEAISQNQSGVRLDWESAFAADLLLRASAHTTTSVQGEWTISRIEWDPSLFCKYRRDKNETYTQ